MRPQDTDAHPGRPTPLDDGSWEVVAPSPLPFREGMQVPREMTRDDMARVRDDFVRATYMAEAAGFDMVELHCAHGYLLSAFITPLLNRRTDGYGGPLENRLRFPLEVFRAMRAAWPAERPMAVRISATDWAEGGVDGANCLSFSGEARELRGRAERTYWREVCERGESWISPSSLKCHARRSRMRRTSRGGRVTTKWIPGTCSRHC